MNAPDLRKQPPRSVSETLAGYVHLGRMLDKCRASLAGTLGEYIYPCPLDKRLLDFAGITPEQFTEAARSRADREVADWFCKTAGRSDAEIAAWTKSMVAAGPDTEDKWSYFRNTRDAIDPRRTDITTWAELLDLEEGRPVPKRNVSVPGGR